MQTGITMKILDYVTRSCDMYGDRVQKIPGFDRIEYDMVRELYLETNI